MPRRHPLTISGIDDCAIEIEEQAVQSESQRRTTKCLCGAHSWNGNFENLNENLFGNCWSTLKVVKWISGWLVRVRLSLRDEGPLHVAAGIKIVPL
jgi:hypothetical protein